MFGKRTRLRTLSTLLIPLGLLASFPSLAPQIALANGGGVTTIDTNVDTTAQCLNQGNPPTGQKCTHFSDKNYVWINSNLAGNGFTTDGQYFFAVLDPGGQADPNDGSAKNLSSASPSSDPYTNRTFTLAGNHVTGYAGTHDKDPDGSGGFYIRVMPYNDTANGGGVYVLAICYLGPSGTTYPVVPSSCNYSTFKIGTSTTLSDLTVVKNANPSFTRTFTWGITKSVDHSQLTIPNGGSATFNYTVTATKSAPVDSNWQVTGTIQVFNPNSEDFSGVAVNDTIYSGINPDQSSTCVVNGGTYTGLLVPANDSLTLPYTCTYSAAPATNAETNVVTATWDPTAYVGTTGSANFSFDFAFDVGPTPPNPTLVDNCVTVTDTFDGGTPTNIVSVPAQDNPTCATTTYTYSRTISGDPAGTCTTHTNTATFTTNTTSTTGTSSPATTATVCVGADLSVSKTATPSFTRTYAWSIAKSVDKSVVKQIGGTATFNYTVNAGETGFTDSAWQASGTITVTNPNNWETITADVTDAVDDGGSCTVSADPILGGATDTGGSGINVTIPKSGTANLPYTCTYSSQPAYNITVTNTATATWDSSAASTPDGSKTGTATFSFTSPTSTVNKTVTITDTFNGGTPTPLGTLTATDTAPYASGKYPYARTLNVPASGCLSYANTATIVETSQTSGQTVTVCGPAKTGALTMGFWQNKNGQTIVQKFSGTNCQTLATWLKQFHPFSDLSATTCGSSPSLGASSATGVVGYVYNVIKAATCTSTTKTCNTMLKAQMLATALDVYFSNPALGGNQIGAPGPIGGVTIDLTKIFCQESDGGTICSGGFENVSSAFGGATSMTVMNMLLYQNTSDPATDAGANWYNQVKATQVLAKDAFDAINNQVVFSA